jgi:hypothetical protein
MRQVKRNWLVVGLAVLAAGMSGCAKHDSHAQGGSNSQPGVDGDAPPSVAVAHTPIVDPYAPAEASKPVVEGAVVNPVPVTQAPVVPAVGSTPAAPAAETPKIYTTSEKWLNHNPEPSLKGLDRSGWEPAVYLTDPGTTEHYNYYHRDFATGYEKRHDADLKKAIDDPTVTLNGYKTEGYNKDNTIEMFSQPAKFAFDTVLMFPIMVVRPPWGTDYTPRKETLAPAVKEKPVDITKVPTQPAPAPVKSDLPQLQAWPTDNPKVDDKPVVIPPLELDTAPGM